MKQYCQQKRLWVEGKNHLLDWALLKSLYTHTTTFHLSLELAQYTLTILDTTSKILHCIVQTLLVLLLWCILVSSFVASV